MNIISYKKVRMKVYCSFMTKNYSACTAVESSKRFKTLKGAIAWLNARGYREA